MIPTLFLAIGIVETNLDPNAVGDRGKSVGIVQISDVCLEDVNRILKLQQSKIRYKPKDRYDIRKSLEIFRVDIGHYCHNGTFEDMARTWNGGPNWEDKPTRIKARTRRYWVRVRDELRKLRI